MARPLSEPISGFLQASFSPVHGLDLLEFAIVVRISLHLLSDDLTSVFLPAHHSTSSSSIVVDITTSRWRASDSHGADGYRRVSFRIAIIFGNLIRFAARPRLS